MEAESDDTSTQRRRVLNMDTSFLEKYVAHVRKNLQREGVKIAYEPATDTWHSDVNRNSIATPDVQYVINAATRATQAESHIATLRKQSADAVRGIVDASLTCLDEKTRETLLQHLDTLLHVQTSIAQTEAFSLYDVARAEDRHAALRRAVAVSKLLGGRRKDSVVDDDDLQAIQAALSTGDIALHSVLESKLYGILPDETITTLCHAIHTALETDTPIAAAIQSHRGLGDVVLNTMTGLDFVL
jgi:hypothetical protein